MKRILLFVTCTGIIFSSWFFTLYPNVGPDISYRYKPIVENILSPYTWNNIQIGDGMGDYVAKTLWSYPSELIFESLLTIGIPYWIQLKVLTIVILGIGLGGIFCLSKRKEINVDWFPASLLYLANTYFILLLDGGQMN